MRLKTLSGSKSFVWLTALIATLFTVSANAQTGIWTGKLEASGISMDLVFNIESDGATLDVPDQGAKGIPVEVTRSATGELTLGIPAINATFKGVWLGKSVVGTYTQHGMSFPMTLTEGAPKFNRPQTPTGPFPYTTEDVSFVNGGAMLKGTLTLPSGCNKSTPVVIMVTGSGLQNRDEELFGHKPFAVIADAFARAGIATLRYDDRGFGESTGDVIYCTTEDLKNDALSGIELLRARFDHVGILGHSEGGSIALMLAAEGKVDFAISLAGMFISGGDLLVWQNRLAYLRAGVDEQTVNTYCKLLEDTFSAVSTDSPLPDAESYDLPDAMKQNYRMALLQFQTPYMKYFVRLNVSELAHRVSCPVMALNGTKDTQVQCDANLNALSECLPADSRSIIKAEPDLNHLFQHCQSGELDEYKTIEETFSPSVLSEIISWISGLWKE